MTAEFHKQCFFIRPEDIKFRYTYTFSYYTKPGVRKRNMDEQPAWNNWDVVIFPLVPHLIPFKQTLLPYFFSILAGPGKVCFDSMIIDGAPILNLLKWRHYSKEKLNEVNEALFAAIYLKGFSCVNYLAILFPGVAKFVMPHDIIVQISRLLGGYIVCRNIIKRFLMRELPRNTISMCC